MFWAILPGQEVAKAFGTVRGAQISAQPLRTAGHVGPAWHQYHEFVADSGESWQQSGSYTARKRWDDLSCVHRNWKGPPRLQALHGYARSVEIEFTASDLDPAGVVVDFSSLAAIKIVLQNQFDHTVLIARDDPLREQFLQLQLLGAADVRIMPDTSLEGSARWIAEVVSEIIAKETEGRAQILRVEVRESPKNAVYLRLQEP